MGTFTSVSPTTGSNGTVISITGPAYTGRTAVTETYQVKSSSGSPQASVTLSATRKAAGLILTNATPPSISAAAATGIIVEGTSNADKLFFLEESNDDFFIVDNVKFSTDGGTTWTALSSETAIPNDPGARATYKWRATAHCAANPTISTRPITLTVGTLATTSPTTAPGQRIVINLTQAAGAPTLSLSESSVTLETTGMAKTVTVTTNTTFSVV